MDLAIVVPCLGNAPALARVIAEVPTSLHAGMFVIDDGSPEPLSAPAPARVLRHSRNRGYGGAQKTGYAAALAAGAERVVLLHVDNQYDTTMTLALAEALETADAVIGSRFLRDGGRAIPGWRRWGNRGLTAAANARFGTHLSELHSGARAFRASALRALPLARFSDDYVFDQQILVGLMARGLRVAERPVAARYDDSVQSIGFRRSLRYGLGCLRVIARGR